jgi:hypothetical protein
MTQQIQQFAEAAEQFCAWAEASPSAPEAEATAALQFLSNLYRYALDLPPLFGEEEPGEVTHGAWEQVYQRFGALPFNYYAQCFDPSDLPTEAVTADLADDLADIWCDLKRGLFLYHAGHVPAAVWEWRQNFWQHWGHHAAGGIYALHAWHTQHGSGAT